jgi:hypothetical protein
MDSVPVRDMPVLITSTVRDGSGLDGWLPMATGVAAGDPDGVVIKVSASDVAKTDLEV